MDGLTDAEVEKHMSESKTEKCEPLKPAQGPAQAQQQQDSQLGAGKSAVSTVLQAEPCMQLVGLSTHILRRESSAHS